MQEPKLPIIKDTIRLLKIQRNKVFLELEKINYQIAKLDPAFAVSGDFAFRQLVIDCLSSNGHPVTLDTIRKYVFEKSSYFQDKGWTYFYQYSSRELSKMFLDRKIHRKRIVGGNTRWYGLIEWYDKEWRLLPEIASLFKEGYLMNTTESWSV